MSKKEKCNHNSIRITTIEDNSQSVQLKPIRKMVECLKCGKIWEDTNIETTDNDYESIITIRDKTNGVIFMLRKVKGELNE